jgi:hypothetical protein
VLRGIELYLADPPQGDRWSASRDQGFAPGPNIANYPNGRRVPSAVPGWHHSHSGGIQRACSHHGGVRKDE